MDHPREININNYNYHLPEESIALRPLLQRHDSRLLIYDNGTLKEDTYKNIADHIEKNATLVFNDTEVINARITFRKDTGSIIEVFCLEPMEAERGYDAILRSNGSSVWKCFVGGAAKWKTGNLTKNVDINGNELTLTATLKEKREGYFMVEFSWAPAHFAFSEVIRATGSVPLPPYIRRSAETLDESRYQTIFASQAGSVAAPTAGLHFTDEILTSLQSAGIKTEKVTLHVGAGTFKPVSADKLAAHAMHAEWIDVSKDVVRRLSKEDLIIPVGTTCLRTLESLYWIGVKIIRGAADTTVSQWEVYESENSMATTSYQEAFDAISTWMEKKQMERLFTQTSILIAPGYKMKVAKGLITNFHQPKSTLLLLIAAGIGNDWKKVYSYALDNGFRFLSYGDGNLLMFPQG